MTLQNEKFEELISQQLTKQLDPQRGRAAAAFRAHIKTEPVASARPVTQHSAPTAGGSTDQRSWARRKLSRAGTLLYIAAPSALAAALALAVTLHFAQPNTTGSIPGPAHSDPNLLAGTGGSQLPAPDNITLANHGIIEESPGQIPLLHPLGTNSPIRATDYLVVPAKQPFPIQPPPTLMPQ